MAAGQRKKSYFALSITLSLICIALIGFGVFLYCFSPQNPEDAGGSVSLPPQFQVEDLDPQAITGHMPGTPRSESSPGPGLFGYRLNATPTFTNGGQDGNILAQNPSFNQYLMVLEIALATEEPQLLYQSKYIAPGQYLPSITLKDSLQAGTYEATAYINVIDPADLSFLGVLDCPITITIQD